MSDPPAHALTVLAPALLVAACGVGLATPDRQPPPPPPQATPDASVPEQRVITSTAPVPPHDGGTPGPATPEDANANPAPPCPDGHVNGELLPRLLAARGHVPPDTFKALVVRIIERPDGSFVYQRADHAGSSRHRDNWWPASTVKLYAAIAALEKARRLRLGHRCEIELYYEGAEEPVIRRLDHLVRMTLTHSHNKAFDQLVEFVGFDELNGRFLTAANGLGGAVMLRSYSHRHENPETGHGTNRISPEIVARGPRGREVRLPARRGRGAYDCPDQGNCTTLAELGEAMRRVMMHEHLPAGERFDLGPGALQLLREAMSGKLTGGVAERLLAVFGERGVELFHKGGYSYRWFSENIFIRLPDTGERWIVVMANRPGRDSLDEAAAHVVSLIDDGALAGAMDERAAAGCP